MTVSELIKRLEEMPREALVVMCMDWAALPKGERPSDQQWEDDLGDIGVAHKQNGKRVYLLNKSFK